MFAVVKTGGKQYKVASGEVLKIEKIAGNAGEKVQFNEVEELSDTDRGAGGFGSTGS